MKNVRKIAAAAVLTVAFSLMGCTSKESISKSAKQEEAQKEIKIELTFLQNECDRLINKDEDIEKTFQSYKNDFNLLSASVNSTAEVNRMNNDELEISINNLEKDVDKLNREEALKAYMKYTSPKTIYKVTMMENLRSVVDATDRNDKSIDFFYDHLHSSQKEINRDINPTVNDIKNGPVYKLSIVKDELQKHLDAFSKEQLEQLETAMKGFDYSLDTQLKTIRSYKNIVNNPYTSNNYDYEEEEKQKVTL
ncbi:hypothetical protein [Priestia megaterium]|uniref:hypothetical protein n=1 Tax=Priestia megaterium TaxID=1404 RepID=UPI0030131085